MKFLLGNKLGMTQMFDQKTGSTVPVTVIEVNPATVTAVKTGDKDGYEAIQLGYGKRNKVNKPEKGHLKELGQFAVLREQRLETPSEKKVGDKLDASIFSEGDWVKVSALAKGKGFQGVVKRHDFRGGPASHGQKHSLREPGSIGSTWPQRVLKGTRMAGRMGGKRKTVSGLKVMKVDLENGLVVVSGSVPGRRGITVELKSDQPERTRSVRAGD